MAKEFARFQERNRKTFFHIYASLDVTYVYNVAGLLKVKCVMFGLWMKQNIFS